MVIDSQAAFFCLMCVVLVGYIVTWFVVDWDRDLYGDKALNFMFAWMIIGWFPMGGIGFVIGLIMGYFSGTLNEYTTGGLLAGMALYIPTGILTYNLHVRKL